MGAIYGAPPDDELDDTFEQDPGAPSADQILDKYIQALGGAKALAGINTLIAKGTSSGYGPESAKRPIEIYAKVPDQRTLIIHTDNGDSTTTYDGNAGWIAAPLRPVVVMELTGGELEGARAGRAPCRFRGGSSKPWGIGAPERLPSSTIAACRLFREPAPGVRSPLCISIHNPAY